ncbi:hypothetical protein P153DRAFT_364586 [Dothidotthia symphoricarpi CBS 119687]|uniref:EthD domain-containing protein n=1 Tax=Dothidotthia symphoricarpi CBS 119687 TaxID=1392245 RepID=A0A6A6ANU1_9PLEO|nr:uncharacterized protein P153DRAFT_364586 [Dothidotthia symphoricarpi CBS 119687]KAF2132161.1 hypothetical protein P153DRAFT_364586 [Dothidotthia symphoricarpi CBS 119687]
MYTVFMFVVRKPGTTISQFKHHYETKHLPLVLEILGDVMPVRHSRHYLSRAGDTDDAPPLVILGNPDAVDYDCITLIELEDEAHFQHFNEAFANSPRRQELEADQDEFTDRAKLRLVGVESVSVTAR